MGRKKSEYIVYDIKTDLPIVLGTLDECSKCLGMDAYTIKRLASLTRRNKDRRYDVFNLDELLKDYKEDE